MAKIAVLSDLHLPNRADDVNRLFARLLEEFRASHVTELWLLGDIFDLFVGNFSFWKDLHRDIFEHFERLSRMGCQITYLEGNHDFRMNAVLESLGLRVRDEVCHKTVSGLACELAHGDLVNTEDAAYLRWRAFTRNPWLHRVVGSFPSYLAEQLLLPMSEAISRKSRKHSGVSPTQETSLRDLYRAHAEARFQEGVQALFLGHCHISDLYVRPGSKEFYLNLGTWLSGSYRYALWEPEKNFLPEVLKANG